ncbi:MBL fold metallo-hydrolase [Thalassovita sp.]|uniref:MBL fold metallo-hydrolase n=1 Tax=Thalassovita sp. TaxID=1979401 RepID=UPI002B266D9D|nr:MBL fold metallo-hydrolase [Thalassovita sp.]
MEHVFNSVAGRVTCLTDGVMSFAPEVFAALPGAERDALLAAAGETDIRTEFNCFLLEQPGAAPILIDAGCGVLMGDKAGALAGQLAERGIAPGAVERIIFTHLHRDHVGGALDGERAVFPNAEIVMLDAEKAFWQGKLDQPGGVLIAAYEGRIRTVSDADEIVPGVLAWHLPGHTPGHMGLRIGDDLVIVADILHAELLQLPHPELSPIYDTDGGQGAETRRAAMAEIAARDLVYGGGHQLSPEKFGRLRPAGQGFAKIAP